MAGRESLGAGVPVGIGCLTVTVCAAILMKALPRWFSMIFAAGALHLNCPLHLNSGAAENSNSCGDNNQRNWRREVISSLRSRRHVVKVHRAKPNGTGKHQGPDDNQRPSEYTHLSLDHAIRSLRCFIAIF